MDRRRKVEVLGPRRREKRGRESGGATLISGRIQERRRSRQIKKPEQIQNQSHDIVQKTGYILIEAGYPGYSA